MMTTIGSTTYSYSIYQMNRTTTQADSEVLAAETKPSRGSAISAGSNAGTGNDGSATTKLTSALWQLASTSENSAKDEAVWNDNHMPMSKAEREFNEYAHMDLAEFIRARYLEEHNMTEEGLAQMDADQRAAIEEEIRRAVLQALGADTDLNGGTEANTEAPQTQPGQ